jgi:2-dehydropantoate 2-reductase
VYIFALAIEPGLVQCFTEPSGGVCDLGRYPRGTSTLAERVGADLAAAGFDSIVSDDIMRWKQTKLLVNLGNVLQALSSDLGTLADVFGSLRAEGEACFAAAGIDHVTWEEQTARYASVMPLALVDGKPFPGGSSWQSLMKGSSRIETDYLNGEIVLLGRLHGVPTPLNARLQGLMRSHLRAGGTARAFPPDELRALLADP